MTRYTIQAGWGDMDFNAHMANTAYMNHAVNARMRFFDENGLPMKELLRLRIGPVVFKDELEYYREAHLLQELTVTVQFAGHSADRRLARLRNEFYRGETKLARITSVVGWLDLQERKLIVPPDVVYTAIETLERTEDFEVF